MPKKARTCAADLPKYLTQLRSEHLSEAELNLLRITSEGIAVPVDQLARYLDRGASEISAVIKGLEELGCLHSHRFLDGDFAWAWPTSRGGRLSGTSIRARERPPALASLGHRRAVHESRLDLESRHPGGRWLCEGAFCSRRVTGVQIPDGAFEIAGKRHAVEVELSAKRPEYLRRVIAQHSDRYDAVIYYVGLRTRKKLLALKEDGRWPKLIVREVPGLFSPARTRPRFPKREAEPWETEALTLISEQGAIPIDQLARFLGRTEFETEEVVDEFVRQNYAGRESMLADKPDWVWVKNAGAHCCGSTLVCRKPLLGGLMRMRALNELRLRFGCERPGAQWISRRRLKRDYGQYADLPDSVVEEDGARHAILVRFHNRHFGDLERKLESCQKDFDSVICFCASETVRRRMSALQARDPSLHLAIEDLPVGV